jgi:hypothetical protein
MMLVCMLTHLLLIESSTAAAAALLNAACFSYCFLAAGERTLRFV